MVAASPFLPRRRRPGCGTKCATVVTVDQGRVSGCSFSNLLLRPRPPPPPPPPPSPRRRRCPPRGTEGPRRPPPPLLRLLLLRRPRRQSQPRRRRATGERAAAAARSSRSLLLLLLLLFLLLLRLRRRRPRRNRKSRRRAIPASSSTPSSTPPTRARSPRWRGRPRGRSPICVVLRQAATNPTAGAAGAGSRRGIGWPEPLPWRLSCATWTRCVGSLQEESFLEIREGGLSTEERTRKTFLFSLEKIFRNFQPKQKT